MEGAICIRVIIGSGKLVKDGDTDGKSVTG
jgi:hypothetical protein